jgi:hypothetical protein
MINHDQLPRDGNGIAQGAWRILHDDPTYHGALGIYEMRNGESTSPACGRALVCTIGEYGSRLYLEPWGELPEGFVLPELVSATVPESAHSHFQPCPWRHVAPVVAKAMEIEPEPHDGTVVTAEARDDLDAMGLEDLRAIAALHEVAIDGRWREPRLREALRSAGIKG